MPPKSDYAKRIAPLIDPSKLATLGKRGANQRVQKTVCWLAEAREAGQKSDKVMDAALGLARVKNGSAAAHFRINEQIITRIRARLQRAEDFSVNA